MEDLTKEQEALILDNALKYNKQGHDLIADFAKLDTLASFHFCIGNAAKYARRFESKSKKANNPEDVAKIQDYLFRAVEFCPLALEDRLAALRELAHAPIIDMAAIEAEALGIIGKSYRMLRTAF